jgi:hypothetical protein
MLTPTKPFARRTEPLRFATRPELREYAHSRYIHVLPIMLLSEGTQNSVKWLVLGWLPSEKLLAKSALPRISAVCPDLMRLTQIC